MSYKDTIQSWLSTPGQTLTIKSMGRAHAPRCAHALIAFSIAAAALSVNPVAAETPIKVTLKGGLQDRYSAKLIGQSLADHYTTVDQMISQSRRHTQDISGGNIEFVRTDLIDDDHHSGRLSLHVDQDVVSDLRQSPMAYQNEAMKAEGVCVFAAPHFDDNHLSELSRSLYMEFIVNSKTDRQDSYLFVAFHEYGHCLQNNLRTGGIQDDIKNSIKTAISQNKLQATVELEILTEATEESASQPLPLADAVENCASAVVKEAISDVFGALKVQQLYYAQNKAQINAGQAPSVSPFLDGLLLTRSSYKGNDPDHDTTLSLKLIIDQLRQDSQLNERVSQADDSALLITAYAVVDQVFSDTIKNSVNQAMQVAVENFLVGEVKLTKNYLNNGVGPLLNASPVAHIHLDDLTDSSHQHLR